MARAGESEGAAEDEPRDSWRAYAESAIGWENWRGPDGELRFVSRGCEAITGYSAERLVAEPGLLLSLVHAEDQARVRDHISRDLVERCPGAVEFRIRRRDGALRWIRHRCAPVRDGDGRYLGQRVVLDDISDELRRDDAYATMRDNSLQGLVIVQDGACVFANRAAAEILGLRHDELVGMSAAETAAMIHPDDRALVVQRGHDRQHGGMPPRRYEFRVIRRDGEVRTLEAFGTPITFRGEPAVQMAYLDVSARREVESV